MRKFLSLFIISIFIFSAIACSKKEEVKETTIAKQEKVENKNLISLDEVLEIDKDYDAEELSSIIENSKTADKDSFTVYEDSIEDGMSNHSGKSIKYQYKGFSLKYKGKNLQKDDKNTFYFQFVAVNNNDLSDLKDAFEVEKEYSREEIINIIKSHKYDANDHFIFPIDDIRIQDSYFLTN